MTYSFDQGQGQNVVETILSLYNHLYLNPVQESESIMLLSLSVGIQLCSDIFVVIIFQLFLSTRSHRRIVLFFHLRFLSNFRIFVYEL